MAATLSTGSEVGPLVIIDFNKAIVFEGINYQQNNPFHAVG